MPNKDKLTPPAEPSAAPDEIDQLQHAELSFYSTASELTKDRSALLILDRFYPDLVQQIKDAVATAKDPEERKIIRDLIIHCTRHIAKIT